MMKDPDRFCLRGPVTPAVVTLDELIRQFSLFWLKMKAPSGAPIRPAISRSSSISTSATSALSSEASAASAKTGKRQVTAAARSKFMKLLYAGAPLAALRAADPKYYLAAIDKVRSVWTGVKNGMKLKLQSK